MTKSRDREVSVLELTLHSRLVGHLVGFLNGRNALLFADQFRYDEQRPTLSLITHPRFPRANKVLATAWARNQRLHPVLSNLLPEGALRELVAQALQVHPESEFHLLSHLGADLPGALLVKPLAPDAVPQGLLGAPGNLRAVEFDRLSEVNRFSLAGVQMKFSMKAKDGRFNAAVGDGLGDWIIKPPSTRHSQVPANEYTAMRLADLVGVTVPEIKLVELDCLDNLPGISLPEEKLAFAIKRFDREGGARIHMEDFAQVLVKYPHEKYGGANYEQLARILYQFSGNGLEDVQQFARRLLVNILLANGDAHLKNWSLLYSDQRTPRLSPAYDILSTSVYVDGEKSFALKLDKTQFWREVSLAHFERWARKAELPWRAIKPHLDDTIARARTLWPEALAASPMTAPHQRALAAHWGTLTKDFRI